RYTIDQQEYAAFAERVRIALLGTAQAAIAFDLKLKKDDRGMFDVVWPHGELRGFGDRRSFDFEAFMPKEVQSLELDTELFHKVYFGMAVQGEADAQTRDSRWCFAALPNAAGQLVKKLGERPLQIAVTGIDAGGKPV